MRRLKLPSPAMTVALVALFVALSGTAFAVGNVIVPHARFADRAKTANTAKVATTAKNALKLNGQTSAALVSQAVSQASAAPGPASTAASLVSTKTAPFSIAVGALANASVSCDTGQKALGGGFSSPQLLFSFSSSLSADGATWTVQLLNVDVTTATGTVYAACLK
jgi:hypothetical protein